MKKYILFCLGLIILSSCKTKTVYITEENPFYISKEVVVSTTLELDSRYVIAPTAFIKTIGKGKVIITEPITILGKRQIFDTDVNLEVKPFAVSELRPEWFGAKGYDQLDDTQALLKTFTLANNSINSLNILVSVGQFKVSETLEIQNDIKAIKSINLLGESRSISGEKGSSFIWYGKNGGSILRIRNLNSSNIENLDFTSETKFPVKHDVELRSFTHNINFVNCSFSGASGFKSANINLNEGNGDQVSEISFKACTFRSRNIGKGFETESGVIGGMSNVMNFYFDKCSFMGYKVGAIDIYNSSILSVENCTFAHNEIDIKCMLCGTYANSNFSEHSKAFFMAGVSSNVAFTSLINNYFTGENKDGYVIRDGSGSLFLLNNNFGGNGYNDALNNIKWEQNSFNQIYSLGNFFKNVPNKGLPFFNRSNQIKTSDVISKGDIGGKISVEKIKIINPNN